MPETRKEQMCFMFANHYGDIVPDFSALIHQFIWPSNLEHIYDLERLLCPFHCLTAFLVQELLQVRFLHHAPRVSSSLYEQLSEHVIAFQTPGLFSGV